MLQSLKFTLVAVLILVLGVPSVATAEAPGSSPNTAIPIHGTMTGSLASNQVRWYQVNYPGGSQSIGLVLSYVPNDTPTNGTVALNVDWTTAQGTRNADWPDLYRIGQGTSDQLPPGTLFWFTGSGNAATYYVEVSNYAPEAIGYALAHSTSAGLPPIPSAPASSTAASGVPASAAPTPPLSAPVSLVANTPSTPVPSVLVPSASPDGASRLDVTNNSVGNVLVGNRGGAYHYYRFAYPGANLPVQVTMIFEPGYPTTGAQGFGFNLFGPNGVVFEGQPVGTNGIQSTSQWTYTFPAAGDVLIQVFNYMAGMQVGYSLTLSGLAGGPTATLTGGSNTTPDKAVDLTTINATIKGTLPATTNIGQPSSYFYTIHYPGGMAPLTTTMYGSPSYPGQGLAYGYTVTCPNSTGGQPNTVTTGSPISGDSNSQTFSSTWVEQSAAVCTLQIANYWVGQAVTFEVRISGMAGPAPAASGNLTGDHAIALNSARPGATEGLTNSGPDAFNYYVVNYPGNLSQLSVAITYASTGGAPDNALGFQVWNGSQLEATIHPIDDGYGVHSGYWQYSDANPATFLIQVQNYAKGTTGSYVIYQVGSQ